MADIFLRNDAVKLLTGKRIAFFGGSNTRQLYKDLVWLINNNSIIPEHKLRKRAEVTFEGDTLVKCSRLTAGRDFNENRKFNLNNIQLEYFFITRCLHEEVRTYLKNIKNGSISAPDVIVMNSTLWDITRWGPNGVNQFKSDMGELMKLLNDVLPEKSMFIWTTALPAGKNIRKGSLLIKQVEFLEHTVRFDVMEANYFAKKIVSEFGFDVVDMHYHLRMQIHRRNVDGLHFKALPNRLMTNVLLTHIALSWDFPLPQNVENSLLERYKNMVTDIIISQCSSLAVTCSKPAEWENNGARGTNTRKPEINGRKIAKAHRKLITNSSESSVATTTHARCGPAYNTNRKKKKRVTSRRRLPNMSSYERYWNCRRNVMQQIDNFSNNNYGRLNTIECNRGRKHFWRDYQTHWNNRADVYYTYSDRQNWDRRYTDLSQ